MAPGGARRESLILRLLSRSSTLATHYQELGVSVCAFHTYSPLSGPHLAKDTNWIIRTDASNAFNSVFRKPMLEQVLACTPSLTGS